MKIGIALTAAQRRAALRFVRRAHDSTTEALHFTRRAESAKTEAAADNFQVRANIHEDKLRRALFQLGELLGDDSEN